MPKHYKKAARSSYIRNSQQLVKLARDVYLLKKLINVEYKSLRTAWTADPSTTGAVLSLSALAQGDDFSDRQGRKIKLFSIRHTGRVSLHASATNTFGRFAVIRDNLGSTTAPTIADVYGSAANFLGNISKDDDPQTNARFSILYDKWWTLNSATQENLEISSYRKIGSHITYTGVAATDEGKGNLYLMSVSSEATNDPSVLVVTTIKFIDN